jgi:hypothetical protein
MTSVCVGGVASQVKAGLPDQIYIDPTFLASILPPQLAWLGPFIPYLPPMFIPLDPFCQAEPPTQPTLLEATFSALIAGADWAAALLAGELIRDAVLNWYWYQVCECSSGTQPTAPTPQTAPSGLVSVNPTGLVTGPTGMPCATFTGSHAVDSTGAARVNLIGTSGTFSTSNQILPANVSRIDVVETQIGANTNQDAVSFIAQVWNAAGTSIASLPSDTVGPVAAGANPRHRTMIVPAGAYNMDVTIAPVFGSAPWTQSGQVDVSVYCGGAQPGQVQTPCCPPDPLLTGMLTQILNYVTTIQRQAVPFGYVLGASHTGLSGAGALSISGLLGVKVAITTLPSSYGVEGTSPPEHFDLGWVTFGTADGFPSAFRLTRNPHFLTPARCSVYTDLDYDLAPGVVVTITELLSEP